MMTRPALSERRPARREQLVRSPLTGGTDVSLVRTIETGRLIDAWRLTYGLDITSEFHGLETIDVYRCVETGLVFFRPEEIAGSPRLYADLQAASAYYPPLKWEHHTALRDLRGTGSLLEIGCGAGSFVDRARRAGIDARGIEVNPHAVAQARNAGLPVHLHRLDAASGRSLGRYDAVCAFQVLEHVPDPGEFLTNTLHLLKPRGTLIVSVPNAQGFLKYYDEILDAPPHHMSQWCRATFEALPRHFDVQLTRCAAEPLAAEHVPVCVSAYARHIRSHGGLAKHLANRYSSGVARRLLRGGLRLFVTGHTLYGRFVRNG